MEERYVHGHHGSVVAAHARRTAADSAAFLLPRLDRAQRLLDVGCGPGTITLDLADYVGWVAGVDAACEAIRYAEAERHRRGIANAVFAVGSAYELPFADAAFDVVFAHQVLQHLADPVGALREAVRVTRPGGIVAVRDADYGTMVHDPPEPRLERWLRLYHEVGRRSGGEPDAGRMVARWLGEAELVGVEASTSTWTYHRPEEVAAWADLWVSRLTEARLGERAIALGLADRDELDDLAEGWRQWAAGRAPFFAFLHGEAIGEKPRAR